MVHVPDEKERLIMLARKHRMSDRGVPFFECPDCAAVSPNRNDIDNKYCFRCHEFKESQ